MRPELKEALASIRRRQAITEEIDRKARQPFIGPRRAPTKVTDQQARQAARSWAAYGDYIRTINEERRAKGLREWSY